jgi:hypothetical protein
MYKLSGTIILLSALVVFWIDKDIFSELFSNRPMEEIAITDLLLPTVLLIIGLFFLFKKNTNAK